jgi:hypothetical protein
VEAPEVAGDLVRGFLPLSRTIADEDGYLSFQAHRRRQGKLCEKSLILCWLKDNLAIFGVGEKITYMFLKINIGGWGVGFSGV